MTWLLLLLTACSPPDGPSEDRDITVDCLAMNPSFLGGFTAWSSVWSLDARTEGRVQRCVVFGSEGLDGGTVPIVSGNEMVTRFGQDTDPWMYLQVVAAGRLWIASEGEVVFDDGFDPLRAQGTYRMTARARDLVTQELTGEVATVEGAVDWCSALGGDCPYQAPDGLERTVSLETPSMSGDGKVVGCRTLVDAELGALRLDLSIGVWNGVSVGSLFVNECGLQGTNAPLPNLLTFTSGGVYGEGTWSGLGVARFAVHDPDAADPAATWREVTAASLDFVHPATFATDALANETLACLAYDRQARLALTEGSICEATVDEAGQRVALTCDEVAHTGVDALGASEIGALSLEADCLVEVL